MNSSSRSSGSRNSICPCGGKTTKKQVSSVLLPIHTIEPRDFCLFSVFLTLRDDTKRLLWTFADIFIVIGRFKLIIKYFIQINIHRLSRWFFSLGHSPDLRATPQGARVACDEHLFTFSCKRIFQF